MPQQTGQAEKHKPPPDAEWGTSSSSINGKFIISKLKSSSPSRTPAETAPLEMVKCKSINEASASKVLVLPSRSPPPPPPAGHIWPFVSKLKKTKTMFLRYTGYLNSIIKPCKAIFISNSSSCATREISRLLISCLTAIKKQVIKYCQKVNIDLIRIFVGLLHILVKY